MRVGTILVATEEFGLRPEALIMPAEASRKRD